MAIPNLAPSYLSDVAQLRAQAIQAEKDRKSREAINESNIIADVIGKPLMTLGTTLLGNYVGGKITSAQNASDAGFAIPTEEEAVAKAARGPATGWGGTAVPSTGANLDAAFSKAAKVLPQLPTYTPPISKEPDPGRVFHTTPPAPYSGVGSAMDYETGESDPSKYNKTPQQQAKDIIKGLQGASPLPTPPGTFDTLPGVPLKPPTMDVPGGTYNPKPVPYAPPTPTPQPDWKQKTILPLIPRPAPLPVQGQPFEPVKPPAPPTAQTPQDKAVGPILDFVKKNVPPEVQVQAAKASTSPEVPDDLMTTGIEPAWYSKLDPMTRGRIRIANALQMDMQKKAAEVQNIQADTKYKTSVADTNVATRDATKEKLIAQKDAALAREAKDKILAGVAPEKVTSDSLAKATAFINGQQVKGHGYMGTSNKPQYPNAKMYSYTDTVGDHGEQSYTVWSVALDGKLPQYADQYVGAKGAPTTTTGGLGKGTAKGNKGVRPVAQPTVAQPPAVVTGPPDVGRLPPVALSLTDPKGTYKKVPFTGTDAELQKVGNDPNRYHLQDPDAYMAKLQQFYQAPTGSPQRGALRKELAAIVAADDAAFQTPDQTQAEKAAAEKDQKAAEKAKLEADEKAKRDEKAARDQALKDFGAERVELFRKNQALLYNRDDRVRKFLAKFTGADAAYAGNEAPVNMVRAALSGHSLPALNPEEGESQTNYDMRQAETEAAARAFAVAWDDSEQLTKDAMEEARRNLWTLYMAGDTGLPKYWYGTGAKPGTLEKNLLGMTPPKGIVVPAPTQPRAPQPQSLSPQDKLFKQIAEKDWTAEKKKRTFLYEAKKRGWV